MVKIKGWIKKDKGYKVIYESKKQITKNGNNFPSVRIHIYKSNISNTYNILIDELYSDNISTKTNLTKELAYKIAYNYMKNN